MIGAGKMMLKQQSEEITLGKARFRNSGTGTSMDVYVKTSTGYASSKDWNGTIHAGSSGTGDPDAEIQISFMVDSNPCDVYIWSSQSGSSVLDGSLTSINCSNESLIEIDVSTCENLSNLDCSYNAITSLDVSGIVFNTLNSSFCSNLTAITAVNASFSSSANIESCDLGTSALDSFFTDLANGVGTINVEKDPGANMCDPNIAHNKGYTVTGIPN